MWIVLIDSRNESYGGMNSARNETSRLRSLTIDFSPAIPRRKELQYPAMRFAWQERVGP
jgi:hypothetical protein